MEIVAEISVMPADSTAMMKDPIAAWIVVESRHRMAVGAIPNALLLETAARISARSAAPVKMTSPALKRRDNVKSG